MANIDWMYDRRSCVTCKKARGFLESAGTEVVQKVDAAKNRYNDRAALGLLKGVDKLVAAKGKKVEVFDLKKDRPTDEELLARLMGPTGNLRAPTARIGSTLVVGFNEDIYQEYFGG